MALPNEIKTLEKRKFVEDKDNEVAVRIIPSGGQSVNPLAKFVERTLINSTTETYEYYESSSKVTLYNTVTVVYTDNTLEELLSAEWT